MAGDTGPAGVITDGNGNVSGGTNALVSITGGTGAQNVAYGEGALWQLTDGDGNIALGNDAGSNYTSTESNNISIGNAGSTGEAGVIRIGTEGTQDSAYMAGIYGSTPGDSGSTSVVLVDMNGNLGSTPLAGIAGATGDTGPQGIQGDTGPTGPTGPAGDTGAQGIQGDTGAQGIQGDTGPQGIQGDTGPQGIQGDTGPQGTTGLDGSGFVVGANDFSSDALNNISTGGGNLAIGLDAGSAYTTESGNVSIAAVGASGDTNTLRIGDSVSSAFIGGIYGVTSNDDLGSQQVVTVDDTGNLGSTSLSTLIGPTGATGDTGPQGIQGDTGPTGPTGDTGAQGIQGDTGPQGIQGDTGAQGIQGDTGPQGIQGDTGPQGTTGLDGSGFVVGANDFSSDALNNISTGGGNLAIGLDAGSAYTTESGNVSIAAVGASGDTNTLRIGDSVSSAFIGGIYGVTSNDDLGSQQVVTVDDTGNLGSTSLSTLVGATGATGDTGPQGIQGDTGPTGPTGDTGAQGIQGDTGPQGIQGVQGDTGPQGVAGDTGPQGPVGDTGPQGTTGLDSSGFVVGANDFSSDALNNISTGGGNLAIGLDAGSAYTTESGNVSIAAVGASGDTNTLRIGDSVSSAFIGGIYGVTSNDDLGSQQVVTVDDTGNLGSTSLGALVGATGATGDTGPQGIQGDTGPTGPTGDTGAQGIQGDTGPQGIQGVQGDTGPQGVAGDTGPQGPVGDTGPAGATGLDGSGFLVGANDYSSDALGNITSGINNLAVGSDAGGAYSTESGNVSIAAFGVSGDSNTLRIGDNVTSAFIGGIYGTAVDGGSIQAVTIDNTGLLGSVDVGTLTGATGDTGPQGPAGDTGPQGVAGDTGPQGVAGDTGPQGVAGDTGPQGIAGDTGPQGASGANGNGLYTDTSETAGGFNALLTDVGDGGNNQNTAFGAWSLVGVSGGTGNIGIGYTAGSAYGDLESDNIDIGNAGVTGETGAIHIGFDQVATTIAGIYGATVDSGSIQAVTIDNTGLLGSVDVGTLTGATGDTGPQGPAGDTGPQGVAGDTGPQGVAGDTGPQGVAGDTGPQGIQGDTGPQGPQGDTGPAGVLPDAGGDTAGGVGTLGNVSGVSNADNTAFGDNALNQVTSGTNNIGIGADAGNTYTTESDNIAIGNVGLAGDTGVIRIGSDQTSTLIAGIYGATVDSGSIEAVTIDNTGLLGSVDVGTLAGPTGPQGNQGDTGPQGIQGDTGPQGIQGDTGPQGIQGDTGPQGVAGDTGPQGIQGDTGPQGSHGLLGNCRGRQRKRVRRQRRPHEHLGWRGQRSIRRLGPRRSCFWKRQHCRGQRRRAAPTLRPRATTSTSATPA